MKIKALRVNVKAGPADGLEEGVFEAYASVWDNVDAYGDVMRRGAFADTLAEWAERDDLLPLLFGHNLADPDYNIGHVVEAAEDDHGLRIRGLLDLEGGKGRQVYRLLKGRRINQLSFGFDYVDAGPATVDGRDVYEVRAVKLYEVSVVTLGANEATEVLSVKAAADEVAAAFKAGRVLAAKHVDSLRAARDAIDGVIQAASVEDDQETAKGSDPAGDEGGRGESVPEVKSTGPNRGSSARALALLSLELDGLGGK